jgi:hypothetical protein
MAAIHVFSGANGSNNYLPDNPDIALTYNGDGNVETLVLTGTVQGVAVTFTKTFTYALLVLTNVSEWVQS